MTTISLHKYHEQINHLVEDSQYSLAASHCRYILQQHPRHVDTYRLLARAMIEQGDYSAATELFQRVLSADPNDYIAHAGLSVVYREEDVLAQAIWHLERAFEIEPYNGAIQQELKGLYIDFSEQKAGARNGDVQIKVPDSLPLTKGALARLYINGEFYAQAIDILQEALAEDEDRIDLEVLLVEALWRDNQRKEAVQVCLQVLEKLPNCITANAVLAEIWLQIGRIDEAQDYLRDLQELTLLDIASRDLESPAGSAFQAEGAIELPAMFEVERLDDDITSFTDSRSLAVSDDSVVDEDGDDYEWLEGLGEEYVMDDAESSSEESVSAMTDSDWLRRELEASEEETAVTDDISSWLDESSDVGTEEDEGIDGLGILAVGAAAAGVIGSQLKDDKDDDAADDEDPFGWLSEESFDEDIRQEDETVFAQMEQAEEAGDMPDWLANISEDDLEPVKVDPSEAAIFVEKSGETDYLSDTDGADEDAFDWLEDVSSDGPFDELEPGELDLSQFAEFGDEEDTEKEDEEVVWRLTDELDPLDKSEEEEELGEFDFEVSLDEMGEQEDVPDWLMGSSGTDELDAVSISEEASREIADELAEWVAANQPEAVEGEEVPDWMIDSAADIEDSTPLESTPLDLEDDVAEESTPLVEEDLPDWLMSGAMDLDDSGFLETGGLSDEPAVSETLDIAGDVSEDLPDWLVGDSEGFAEASANERPLSEASADLPDWLLDDVDGEESQADDEDDDVLSGKTFASGLLSAAAAGAFAKKLLDDDDDEEELEDQPEPLSLEEEVMEDTVSDKQDDLIGPQDEPEKPEPSPREESDEFDWLNDLDGTSSSADTDSVPIDDLGGDLDWMDLDDSGDSDELNLDALLGLEPEEPELSESADKEAAEPITSGLAEDESLDWLDALAGDDAEAVDEMPTWQWSEDSEEAATVAVDKAEKPVDASETEQPVEDDVDAIFADEPAETDLVEDLDDAMSWLEDLAAEPDAPIEELPSVAEDMDFDDLFATDADVDLLSGETEQTETLDEIFAADTQNDSWLESLAEAEEEPIPDFLEEDDEVSFDGVLHADIGEETAVFAESEEAAEAIDGFDEPPEDPEEAMAWLEQLAARQGASLDELPYVDETSEDEEDGIDVTEVAAATAAVGAIGAVLADDDEKESEEIVDAAEAVSEDDLLAAEVPDDPEEAMAWLERLAARQGAPLDELPYVSKDDGITPETEAEAEADLFGLGVADSTFDDLLTDAETLPDLIEAEEELGDLDEAMTWLEGLEAEDSASELEDETSADDAFEADADLDFEEEEIDLPEDEGAEETTLVEEPAPILAFDLSDELDWLESVTGFDGETAVYNPDEISVSDDELDDALDKLALLTVAGAAVGIVSKTKDEPEVEKDDVLETAVVEPEATTEISAEDFIEEMPEDPDEAMAWLEKLAARQGAPLDELPSVEEGEYDDLEMAGAALADEAEDELSPIETDLSAEAELLDEPTTIAASEAPMSPEDMDVDDAMAWLEQLAARQGTSLDELPTVDESDVEGDVAASDWVADVQQETEEELLVFEEGSIEDEPVVAEEETVVEETPLEEVIAEDETMDLPEDMDDAMAWLEKLAARQGADLDELPTVDDSPETEDDIDTPEWIARQTGPLDAATLESLDIPIVGDEPLETISDEDFFAALDEVPAIEGIETSIKDSDIEDIDDSMPDWLSSGEDDSPLGHTGWLNTIVEPDMGGWLAAEAEASTSSDVIDGSLPEAVDTDSLIHTGGLEDTDGLQESVAKGDTGELSLPDEMPGGAFTTELDEAQILADLDLDDFGAGLDQAQLEAARSSLASGDVETALLDYQNLVEAGESMHTVISDLERAAELHQDKPMVSRMLGDAYMRNGQINKAIETYRDALDQM